MYRHHTLQPPHREYLRLPKTYDILLFSPLVKESPHIQVESVVAGNFRRDSEYTNWRSRGTNDWLLIFTIDGCGRVASGSHEIIVQRGTVTLYQPGTPQYYRTDPATGRWHILWCHFQMQPRWKSWLDWPTQTRGLKSLELRDAALIKNVSAALLDLIRFIRQDLPGNTELAYNALERSILWINSANLHSKLDERIRHASNFLAENLNEPFSLARLSKECGLSPSRLAHLFREQIGIPPQQYQEKLRLQWATELLRSSNLSVSEIAEEIGYANAFYFSARFKKAFGKSPAYYRKQ